LAPLARWRRAAGPRGRAYADARCREPPGSLRFADGHEGTLAPRKADAFAEAVGQADVMVVNPLDADIKEKLQVGAAAT
jgi:hypothetical protein